jgi:hypothetical protein
VLERGPIVEHVVDYPTMNLDPWDMELRGGLTPDEKKKHYKKMYFQMKTLGLMR